MIRIEDHESAYGTITILKARKTGAIIYEQLGFNQSECDCNGTSLASYIHAIFGLIWQARSQSILMIGCAGGTLGTMLSRIGKVVTIVDVNPAAFRLARQYFNLPEIVECYVADGRDFLQSGSSTFDAIVIDAYHGDRVPTHLQTRVFFKLVRSRLSMQGAVFANIHVEDDLDLSADRFANQMAKVWPRARLLDTYGLRGRNAIAMAGDVSEFTPPCILVPPVVHAPGIGAELAMMRFRARKRTP